MSDDLEDEGRRTETSALRAAEVSPGQRSLAEILERLPTEPGVYVMKDRRGKILYIGKAASLRTRVRQYFQPNTGDIRDFVPLLEGIVADIETTVTSNEKEALLLENNLIKKHQPRFNVKLRDDKNYLVLRLDPEASWPRLEVVRRIQDDGAHYFGPYHSASACREALRVVNRHFQLRTCTDHVLANRRRPCLQYQIKRCPAPCVMPVPREEYGEQVRDVRLFLDGKNDELLDRLRTRMKESSARTEFERAALVRDQIRALESTLQAQRVVSTDFVDQDVVGFHREGIALEIAVIAIRQGKMAGTRCFSFTDQEFPDAEILSSFVGLYYDLSPAAPDEVLLPFAIADAELKADWLTELRAGLGGGRRRRVEVLVPQRGTRRELLELAQKNAAASFASRRNTREDAEAMLAKLQKRLRLPRPCRGSSSVTTSPTCRDRRRWPRWSSSSTASRRRPATAPTSSSAAAWAAPTTSPPCTRCCRGGSGARARRPSRRRAAASPGLQDSPWQLPDLIVVDGGKGQLGMALAAARDVGIDVRPGVGLPIVALAKEREPEPAVAPAEPPLAGPPVEASTVDLPGDTVAPAPTCEAPTAEEVRARGGGGTHRRPVSAPSPHAPGSRRRGEKDRRVERAPSRPRVPGPGQGRHPDPAQQRRDVRARAPARRGPPLRRDLPPQPAPAPHLALGALGHRRCGHRPPARAAAPFRQRAEDPGRQRRGPGRGPGRQPQDRRGGARLLRRPRRGRAPPPRPGRQATPARRSVRQPPPSPRQAEPPEPETEEEAAGGGRGGRAGGGLRRGARSRRGASGGRETRR